jgi:ABC-type lipoprotein release transport system permease subunit
MGIILGIKNVSRNPIRLVIAALLISVPLFLVLTINAFSASTTESTRTLTENVDNKLQIRAKGAMGHVNMKYDQDKLLPASAFEEVKKVDHITKVESYLLAMSPFKSNPSNFAIIIGVTPGDTKRLETHGETGGPRIIAGRDLRPEDENKDVGVIGKVYAKEFGITPENFKPTKIILDPSLSSDVIYPIAGKASEIEIVGIFESGYVFGDMQLFIPKKTLQKTYPPTNNDGISWIFITVDSADNIAAVTSRLKDSVGSYADIISPINTAEFVSSSGTAITNIAVIGTGVAGFLASIVVFFVTLIIVRERKREIGTLKAIGASNKHIIGQFLAESITFTLIGSSIAVILFSLAGNSLAGPLLGNIIGAFSSAAQQISPSNLDINTQINLNTLLLLLGVSVVVAVLGSLYSIMKIAKLSPVEAMRYE